MPWLSPFKHLEKLTAHSFLAWFVPRLYFNSHKVDETTWRWRCGSERLRSICWWHSMRKDSLTVDSGNSCEGDLLKTPLLFSLGIGNAGGSWRIFWIFHGLCMIIRIPVVFLLLLCVVHIWSLDCWPGWLVGFMVLMYHQALWTYMKRTIYHWWWR